MNKKLLGYTVFFIVLVTLFFFFVFNGTDILSKSTLDKRGYVQPFAFPSTCTQYSLSCEKSGCNKR